MGAKNKYFITGLLLFVLIITLMVVLAFENSDYREKDLGETLDINTDEITKITLSTPIFNSQYKTTTDQDEIETFIKYFDQVEYQRLSGDQSTYMPMKASSIYIYGEEKSGFIIPYENEAMINYRVYRIKLGKLENQFLIDFYNSIAGEP
ncbi:hypothetical protein [Virgibacillus ainsalahensis]